MPVHCYPLYKVTKNIIKSNKRETLSMFNVGNRIENIDPRPENGKNYGKLGRVTSVRGGYTYVTYDDGSTGKSNKPEKYYQVIEEDDFAPEVPTVAPCTKTTMKNPVSFFKSLTLSKEEKLLRKFGLKTDTGEFTQQAREIVMLALCEDNTDLLVDVATKLKNEKKDDKDEAE